MQRPFASHLTKRQRAAFDQRRIGITHLGKARVLGVHINRRAVLINLTQHDSAFVMRAILVEWLQNVKALTAGFFLQRQAGMFADDGIKGGVLAFLDLEFNGDGDFGHRVSSCL